MTNALSQVDENSGAAIQFVVRSSNPAWHKWGQKTASIAFQGKKINEAIIEASSKFSFKKFMKFIEGWTSA